MIDTIAMLLAVSGGFLVCSGKGNIRLFGFAVWVVSSTLWFFIGMDFGSNAMMVQYVIFGGQAIWGVKNNAGSLRSYPFKDKISRFTTGQNGVFR